MRVLGRKSTCLCPSLRRTTQALGWSFLPEQMWIQIYTRALFLPRTPQWPRSWERPSQKRRKRNSATFPATSWLPWTPASPPLTGNITTPPVGAPSTAESPADLLLPCCEPPRLGLPPGQGPNASLGVRVPHSPARICLSVFMPHCNASGALTGT